MSELSAEAAEQIRLIEQQVADAQKRAEAATRLRDEIELVRESATSSGREVTIEVDSVGRVVNVTFAQNALAMSADDLSRVTLDTIRKAHAAAGRVVMGKVENTFGADSATTQVMRETFEPKEYGDSPEARRGPKPTGPKMFGRG